MSHPSNRQPQLHHRHLSSIPYPKSIRVHPTPKRGGAPEATGRMRGRPGQPSQRSLRKVRRICGGNRKGQPPPASESTEDFWALKDVSFESLFHPGEVWGIL